MCQLSADLQLISAPFQLQPIKTRTYLKPALEHIACDGYWSRRASTTALEQDELPGSATTGRSSSSSKADGRAHRAQVCLRTAAMREHHERYGCRPATGG